MNVKAGVERLVGLHAAAQRAVAERKRGVQTESSRRHAVVARALDEPDVFGDGPRRLSRAVAVARSRSKCPAQSRPRETPVRSGPGFRRRHWGWSDDRSACLRRISAESIKPNQRAVVDVLRFNARSRRHQSFVRISRKFSAPAGKRDAARQRAVEMRVAIDERGHQKPAAGIDDVSPSSQRPLRLVPIVPSGRISTLAGSSTRLAVVEGQDACVGDDHARHDVRAAPAFNRFRHVLGGGNNALFAARRSTNSMPASIFGPIEPAGNSPPARYWRAWPL